MSMKAVFLIVAGAAILHVTVLKTILLLLGYVVCDAFDEWSARRARKKAIEDIIADELEGWETGPDDPNSESKGSFSRMKLPQTEQIMVGRIGYLMRRLLLAARTTYF